MFSTKVLINMLRRTRLLMRMNFKPFLSISFPVSVYRHSVDWMERSEIGLGFVSGKRWQEIATKKRRDNMSKTPKDWLLPEKALVEGRQRKRIA